MISGSSIARGSTAAILIAPPLAWITFFLVTSQNLGQPKADDMAAVVMMFMTSVIITAVGICMIAVPLTLAANRIFRKRPELVALCTSAVGIGLGWFVVKQEGPVIDFVSLMGFHIGFAAIIYSGVCLLKQRRSKYV